MSSRHNISASFAALAALCWASGAAAEEPDMRNYPPFVMIVADTSGSMERLPTCTCTTLGCTECLPDCTLTNDPVTGEAPSGKKNRWAVVLEALTGKFINFQCLPLTRTAANGMTYDTDYAIPYNRPWLCPNGDKLCGYPGTATTPIQIENGLLDNYSGRIRFGLATFDGMLTYVGKSDLVESASFSESLSVGTDGSYSYGGSKTFHYPTCTTDYRVDSGIRGPTAAEGGLISLNSTNACSTPPCDMYELNAQIQKNLLAARTYGGTPTAAALDDLYYHLKTDLNDSLASCRERYAILITDGYPDDDFRQYGCDCKKGLAPYGLCPANEDPNKMHCPYPLAKDAAYALKHGKDGDDPMLSQLFVVGMSITDNASRVGLNEIASAGGSLDLDKDGNEAFFADNPATLTSTLDRLLGDLTRPISRSVPAFATGLAGKQYQVSAGFSLSSETPPVGFTPPWKGILERRRFECVNTALTAPTLTDDDRFDVQLNKQSTRSLWTALPTNPDTTKASGKLTRGSSSASCGTTGCSRVELSSLDRALFNLGNDTLKTTLIDWMYGNSGSIRANKKLGDIYHSSPTIVGPPTDDPGDQSYSLFRESALIEERPVITYVNSNDGILHAFSLEEYPPANVVPTVHPGLTLKGGQEIWGFVPPILLKDLNYQLSAHRLNLDGTPVVKDVYFSKGTAPTATDYHTVLITNMRAGGNGYIALDVTDPIAPKFMWQFTDADMGETYGQPEIVQAMYEWPAGQPASLRAMAILPGGKGKKGPGPGCTGLTASSMRIPSTPSTRFATLPDPDGSLTTQGLSHRGDVPCWERIGRALYFVDIETGELIKKIFDSDSDLSNGTIFPSPLTGTPTAYQDAVGTIATEGYVMDADGVLWRIDISAKDPRPSEALSGWTVRPFHDLFWDMGPNQGETTYERPILSLDSKHRLVVIVGTGDTDNFEKPTVQNRIVSLTELTTTATPSQPSDYIAALNWEHVVHGTDGIKGFVNSELVTGTMALFDSQLFAASFMSVGDTTDPCARGLGRLWSFHFRDRDPNAVNPLQGSASSTRTYGPKRIAVVSSDTSGNNADLGLFNIPRSAAESNLLVQGLGTTQRISCEAVGTNLSNYFSPALVPIQQQSQPSIYIVAQASSDNKNRTRAGSQLGTLEVKLNRPLSLSQVSSWAGSIE